MNEPMREEDRKAARWLFLIVFFISSIFIFDANDGNTDSEVHFQQIRAMGERGSFAFEPDSKVTQMILQLESTPGAAGAASQKGVDGRVYGHFGVYYVFAGVPLFAIGAAVHRILPETARAVESQPFLINGIGSMEYYFERLAVTFISPLFLACGAWAIFLASRRLGAGRAPACIMSLSFAFATYAGVQARHCGSDTMAAGLLALCLERALAARDAGRIALLQMSVAAGLLFGSRYLALAVLPGVELAAAIVILRRTPHWRSRAMDGIAAAGPFVVLSGIVLACNYFRWGSPFDFGYHHSFITDGVIQGDFLDTAPLRLFYSFFSPSRGLAVFAAAVVIPGTAGLILLVRRDRAFAAAILLGIATTAVLPSLSLIWHGTISFGPRYHLACLAFFAVPGALALQGALDMGKFMFTCALAPVAAGALISFPGLVTSPFGFLLFASEALRIERPASSYSTPAFRDSEALVESDRQEFLTIAPFASPYNPIGGQWRMVAAAIRGDAGVATDRFFGIPGPPRTLIPAIVEHTPNRSPWWATLAARIPSRVPFLAPLMCIAAAALSVIGMRRAFRSS